MILSCPACQTTFVVADAVFGSKQRRVRCGKCQHDWLAAPPLTAAETPPDITPAPKTIPPIPKGSNVPATIPETSLWDRHGSKLITAVGALFFLYVFASALGGAGINLSFNGLLAPDYETALALEDVKTRYAAEEPTTTGEQQFALVVEGMVRNVSEKPMNVPPIVIEIKDKSGKVVASQNASLQTQTLPPGQSGSFLQSFSSPPEDIADITVAFHTDVGDNSTDKNKEPADKQHE